MAYWYPPGYLYAVTRILIFSPRVLRYYDYSSIWVHSIDIECEKKWDYSGGGRDCTVLFAVGRRVILGGWRSAVEPGQTFRALENLSIVAGCGDMHVCMGVSKGAEGVMQSEREGFDCGEGSLCEICLMGGV